MYVHLHVHILKTKNYKIMAKITVNDAHPPFPFWGKHSVRGVEGHAFLKIVKKTDTEFISDIGSYMGEIEPCEGEPFAEKGEFPRDMEEGVGGGSGCRSETIHGIVCIQGCRFEIAADRRFSMFREIEKPEIPEYEPWTHDDVESLLFFKDKIFRAKTEPEDQKNAVCYDASDRVVILWDCRGLSFKDLLDLFEYSTDGENWLPCGKLKHS